MVYNFTYRLLVFYPPNQYIRAQNWMNSIKSKQFQIRQFKYKNMKIAGFILLCVVATSLATPLSASPRPRRQSTSCETSSDGLAGVLEQVGNLVSNLLDNLGRLNLAALVTGNHGVIRLLSDLLKQIVRILNDLLSSDISDDDADQRQGLVVNLLDNVSNLLNDLLGDNSGTNMSCRRSNGPTGKLLGTVLGALDLNSLTGLFNNDHGLLTGLLKIVIRLLTSLIALLV